MASKNERGYSLIELVMGLGILVFVGSMVGRYFTVSHKAAQEIETKNTSHQDFMNLLQKIRREMSMRDSKVPLAVQPTSMTLSIPLSSTAKNNFTLTLTSKCRSLPKGETLDLSRVKLGLVCLQSIDCKNGVPYIEWKYADHPQLTSREQPENQVFQREIKKVFSAPSLGLCFSQTADSITIEGILVNLKKDGQTRFAEVASESLIIPIGKRNNIELVP